MSELLGRAVRILEALGRAEEDLTIRELAERAELPKSSVQRLLRGLVDTELATQHSATQAYRLGPRSLALGMAYLRRTDLRTVAMPHLSRLRERTGETAGLSIVVGEEMYHVEQVQSGADLRRTFAIGRPHPLWAGAPSRLLLGGFPDSEVRRILAERPDSAVVPVNPPPAETMLAQVRRGRVLGYATAFEETIAGVHTLAAAIPATVPAVSPGSAPGAEQPATDEPATDEAIADERRAPEQRTTERRDGPGRPESAGERTEAAPATPVPATIAVTGPSVRFTQEAMDACLPDLLAAAARISRELGGALGHADRDS